MVLGGPSCTCSDQFSHFLRYGCPDFPRILLEILLLLNVFVTLSELFYNIVSQIVQTRRRGNFTQAVRQAIGPKYCPKCDPVGTTLDISTPRCTPQCSEKWYTLHARFSVNFATTNTPNATPLDLENMVFVQEG